MQIEKILIVEDDLIARKNLDQQLRKWNYEVKQAASLNDARRHLDSDSFDVIILDVDLPDGQGPDILKELQNQRQRPMVIMSTGFGTVDSAVECIKAGAFDYLIKPTSPQQLEITLKKAELFNQLVQVNNYHNTSDEDEGSELLGRTEQMKQVRKLIRTVARTQATVLIQGENGTGKELVARALFRESPRREKPYIKVNCAAISESLIESEFFGHEKGSFTGAISKRLGRFELADTGTILLDEISEISLPIQTKLLRVLQEREFERVGGNRTIRVDVRVIATTNRDLKQSVRNNEFREDLFFRLNVIPIQVPPLRERLDDITYLADHFLKRFSRKNGIKIAGLSQRCQEALLKHKWPGNVRELQNSIERGVILCGEGKVLEPEHIFLDHSGFIPLDSSALNLRHGHGSESSENPSGSGTQESVHSGSTPVPDPTSDPDGKPIPLADLERKQIYKALQFTENNKTRAAEILGISIRTLRNKLNEYRDNGTAAPGENFGDED
jgi:DNA-binding NtrC family response regulator